MFYRVALKQEDVFKNINNEGATPLTPHALLVLHNVSTKILVGTQPNVIKNH